MSSEEVNNLYRTFSELFFNYSLCIRGDQSQPAVYDAAGGCETPLPAAARHDTSG
jgi:hypothetical protein